ncbi:MAG: response regulator [Vicinamibacterales bacterium]
MAAYARTTVLCVDDEPQVLEGLMLVLRRRYDVTTATSGAAGLEALKQRPTKIVMSDMRMPGMDGATFLKLSRELAPDAVRLLLTGHSDVGAAIAAINEGEVFRILEKPCLTAVLTSTMEAATRHHRLATAEQVLLEQTLRGSIKALTDALALAHPMAFGRATRIRHHVMRLVGQLQMTECWQVDLAAMACQLGAIALPPATFTKLYYGQTLATAEAEMVARMPKVTQELLGNIPRLEVVLAMLAGMNRPYRPLCSGASADDLLTARGAELLKIATDFELLEARGLPVDRTVVEIGARPQRYEPAVLAAFLELHATRSSTEGEPRLLSDLTVGMVLAEDLKSTEGLLVATRGYRVTAGFIERLHNASKEILHLRVHVIMPGAEREQAAV